MRAFPILALALSISAGVTARTPTWVTGPCSLTRAAEDATVWSFKRQSRGALLTITKSGWERSLPKGESIDLILHFGGGGFGHPRELTATKVYEKNGNVSLAFPLDDELILTFKVMNGVKLMSDGSHELTGWLDLVGSYVAFSRLAHCRFR